jgi:uncharacterized membrane protein YtjA (UPF0391 family)
MRGQDAGPAPEDSSTDVTFHREEYAMLHYAPVFLVVGVIAGALNLAGVSAVAVQISWILFLMGIVLVAIQYGHGPHRSG